ncbi:MAG: hypothetical protein HN921_14220 [Bacteroidetes bacterium]|nr:hypothetical protein [Bacteroidota bacterium]
MDDRKPAPLLFEDFFCKVIGNKGYISKDLFVKLLQENVQLVTGLQSNLP